MLGYLEAIGVHTLADLACREAPDLALAINVHIGRRHINSTGVAALANAVAAARNAQIGTGTPDLAIPASWQSGIEALLAKGQRIVLGLAGTPGAGKSTLAAAITDAIGSLATVVPMDGFHLANVELARLGLAHRKGAPETFDATGFTALLARIRAAGPGETVYAPAFRREIEEPVAGAIPVLPEHRLIVTEGNYLLLDDPGWAGVRPVLDLCWYVDIASELRHARLVARHMHFGRDRAQAEHWIASNDALNAALIERTRDRADKIVTWPPQSGPHS